uniref:Tripartite motif-containing protein 47 n=1 Tax=Eptatretus burgeri TaxID=7764 RepID=A0A8C4WZX6_EPTBU
GFHSMTAVCSDELKCTVCLQLYKKPVTLPCGHSFCHACIENHWESQEVCNCPNCREVFTKKPELKKNVVLASLVEQLKLPKTPVKPEVDVQVEDIEHHCEVCNGMAAKLCVPCEITCCEIHVKPHEQKGHKLVEPGVNVEELSCTKHGKPIELYCKDDESLMCVMCMMCTAAQHENHNIVPVDIFHAELKSRVIKSQSEKIVLLQKQMDERKMCLCFFRFVELRPRYHLFVSADGRTPSLDPNSAHSEIMISQDLRTATRPGTEQPYPEHPDRFTFYPQVFSSESFSSGCHYWEVDVSLSGWCETGVFHPERTPLLSIRKVGGRFNQFVNSIMILIFDPDEVFCLRPLSPADLSVFVRQKKCLHYDWWKS